VIDHTLLKAEATEADVRQVVAEAVQHRFASVCVNGRWADLVSDLLHAAGADEGEAAVATCAVVGFPLGAMKAAVKAIEATAAVKDGAREIDMVVSLADLLDGRADAVRQEIFDVVRAARAVWRGTVVKVILETAALTEEQVAVGCAAAREGGADFVKTSTGFHPKGGATAQAVGWLKHYGGGLQVKASGGIRDAAAARAMLAAGADRLGCSAGVAIVTAAAAGGAAGGGY
jgi:deoxyribose-phosphate aldolase